MQGLKICRKKSCKQVQNIKVIDDRVVRHEKKRYSLRFQSEHYSIYESTTRGSLAVLGVPASIVASFPVLLVRASSL